MPHAAVGKDRRAWPPAAVSSDATVPYHRGPGRSWPACLARGTGIEQPGSAPAARCAQAGTLPTLLGGSPAAPADSFLVAAGRAGTMPWSGQRSSRVGTATSAAVRYSRRAVRNPRLGGRTDCRLPIRRKRHRLRLRARATHRLAAPSLLREGPDAGEHGRTAPATTSCSGHHRAAPPASGRGVRASWGARSGAPLRPGASGRASLTSQRSLGRSLRPAFVSWLSAPRRGPHVPSLPGVRVRTPGEAAGLSANKPERFRISDSSFG